MIKDNQKILNALLALIDAGICFASMMLAYALHFWNYQGVHIEIAYYVKLQLYIIPIYFFLYHYFDLHDSFRHKSLVSEIGSVVQANTIGTILIFVLVFFLKEVHVSRFVILMFGILNVVFSSLFRFSLRKLLRRMRARGYNLKHLLLVGWNDVSAEFYDRVLANHSLGYDFVGYLEHTKAYTAGRSIAYAGGFSSLPSLLDRKGIDQVIISLDYNDFSELGGLIEACEKAGVKSNLLPFYTKYLPTRPYIDEVEGMPLINIRKVPIDNILNSFSKRLFDIVVSLFSLVLFSPLMAMTALGIKLTSPGPVIYKQERIGRQKQPFQMYKFRSMKVENDNSDMNTWGTGNDCRRTKFGALIRKFSIDELPQLINVLKGDMSLVGPRPERPYFVDKFKEEIPLYMLKHLMRPGITGWAQVNGWRGDTSIEERIKCDMYYIENWTFLLDVKILLLTVFKGFVNRNESMR
ncbi:undecaprenyl-phosphate glucose phosphotransferase [Caproicibacter fermentans]|uniref:Undecaprenyl-phosphate glucose phosphotransferase n=1 Tax=Caproicibacter fermentans TaxID=2576756 RepID=A0A7G8T680_9FIRM|nr:undecaprenyl-phosphate glucose phosphotransferase [Caproicibacter fermentans]QNK39121.1 undecaprenyl-phosphate glucose phosphotransferase [Caproicibacter fermentans]